MTVKELNPKLRILTKAQSERLEEFAKRLTSLEDRLGFKLEVTSGFRTDMDQMRINHRNRESAHTTGEAGDFKDPMWEIYDFLKSRPEIMDELDFYVELKEFAKNHLHLQIRPTKSGNRFFKP